MKSCSGFWTCVTTSGAAAALRVSCASPARLLRVSCASPAHSSQHPHHHAHIAPQALPTASIAMKLLVVALAFASREAAAFMRVKALRKSGPQGVMPAQPRPAHAPTPALERGLSIRRVAVRSGKKTSILHPERRLCVCVPLDRGWLIRESSRARLAVVVATIPHATIPHAPIVGSPLAALLHTRTHKLAEPLKHCRRGLYAGALYSPAQPLEPFLLMAPAIGCGIGRRLGALLSSLLSPLAVHSFFFFHRLESHTHTTKLFPPPAQAPLPHTSLHRFYHFEIISMNSHEFGRLQSRL